MSYGARRLYCFITCLDVANIDLGIFSMRKSDVNFIDISLEEASARPGTEDPGIEEKIGGGEINNEDNNNNNN